MIHVSYKTASHDTLHLIHNAGDPVRHLILREKSYATAGAPLVHFFARGINQANCSTVIRERDIAQILRRGKGNI